jgi:hypothetical protein
MGSLSHPAMSPRKQRAIEIASREARLRERQGDFDRQRARSGRARGVSVAEQRLRAEMSALARERTALLEHVIARQAELRQRQSRRDHDRAAAASRGGQLPVTEAEIALRAELAALESERAHLDGSAQRARDEAELRDTAW